VKTFAVAYFFMLGYLAKKYEIPSRIGGVILEGVRVVGVTAGASYQEGLNVPDIASLFPSQDENRST
jgi:hypothetical protein